ncbi:hypothetical protein AMATHDRAFT_76995 [Amanita thiersii Skay4041]|uniref:Uncharacterized protein n=1 Tax=Amanita thiersii Skay4041 TaxID=703135 RepID=A0A2A9NHU4_9AGAR|nr:hypothetical protein AMATHDRAFT_76995 [Amanita thiersii Skay4041]
MEDIQKPDFNQSNTESLSQGVIQSKSQRTEYTILLVGETGTGKTSLLSLIANILAGRTPIDYSLCHDNDNEAGSSAKHSQTHSAKLYEFESRNGIKVRILDTPGLADTRGIQQDELHKASIAKAIQNNIATINGVIILANGTLPRLGAATDYALSTLSGIFPHSLVHNIGLLFTNVSSPLSWNFDQNSLPDALRNNDNQFLIDNPLAMWKRLRELNGNGHSIPRNILVQMEDTVMDGHRKALNVLGQLFDWLDRLEPQPTQDIMILYQQSQAIDQRISDALARTSQLTDKKKRLKELIELAKGSLFSPTPSHNTLCSHPDCYSNCHISCGLEFTLAPAALRGCLAMSGETCKQCGHSYLDHRHYNVEWQQEDDVQKSVDTLARRNCLAEVGELTQSYAKLSLSGSFAGQIKKSVRLIEVNLEAMRHNKADLKSIEKVEKSLEHMKDKLIVETAAGNLWE